MYHVVCFFLVPHTLILLRVRVSSVEANTFKSQKYNKEKKHKCSVSS